MPIVYGKGGGFLDKIDKLNNRATSNPPNSN